METEKKSRDKKHTRLTVVIVMIATQHTAGICCLYLAMLTFQGQPIKIKRKEREKNGETRKIIEYIEGGRSTKNKKREGRGRTNSVGEPMNILNSFLGYLHKTTQDQYKGKKEVQRK